MAVGAGWITDATSTPARSAVALCVRTLIRCVVVVSSPPGFDDVLIVKAAAEGVMRSPVQIVTGGVLGARAERPGVVGRLLMIDHLVARPAASKVAHGALDGFRRSTTACASLATTLSRWCYLLAKRPAVTMSALDLQTTIAAAVRG